MNFTLRAFLLAFPFLCAAQTGIRGFPLSEVAAQRAREQKMRSLPDPSRIRTYLERMSAQPHLAGSPQSRAVAEYALGLLKEWGLEARIENFEALLPYPTSRQVEMVWPVRYQAKLQEPVLAEDRNSSDRNQIPTYNAYSASGDVTAPLLYVNYGLPEDYEHLKRLGIDAKGKVVLARYGRSWRGTKPKVAQERGAVACIIYSDPRDDGYFQGDVYPLGPYRPPQGVQRGSVLDMPVRAGDPLSPGWASEPGSKRLKIEEAETLMKIPVLPISYEDAAALLAQLRGPVAPEGWRGALGLTYHVGPGPAKVRVKLDFDWSTKPLYNVIASIPGSEYPDQWLLYGNHHDAWVNGASDPLSGASALLETARALAELRKTGWNPKRSIQFALWDGEEFGLIGSTEWVEKHKAELDRKLVVYLNSDSTGKGGLGASGSHTLEQMVREVLSEIPDPANRRPLIENRRVRERKGAPKGSRNPADFHLGALGAGSDYVAFLDHVGIASLNLGFGGDGGGGVYHSIYDSLDWYLKFSDGDLAYGATFSGVTGTLLMRLADAPLLPFEFTGLAKTVERYAAEIAKEAAKQQGGLDWKPMRTELARLDAAAKSMEVEYRAAVHRVSQADAAGLAAVNEAMFRTERALLAPAGLPGRPWYKHQLYAPGLYTGYGVKTLPGIREAVEGERWDEAHRQSLEVAKVLRALTAELTRIGVLLKGL